MESRVSWRTLGWALPWLLFQAFPIADLVLTPRPAWQTVVAGVGLVVFTVAYLIVFSRMFGRRGPARGALVVVVVLAVTLSVWLGTAWAGLLIYVSAAVSVSLPRRWIWPAVLGATAVCTAVVAADGLLGDVFILPVMCLLTSFALQGTRHLVSVNTELMEARDELARNAVAEERLRFARDLHDLLGHTLSLIALKSELAAKLLPGDPARARDEITEVQQVTRQALTEVREAVHGYRRLAFADALDGARAALSAAGIDCRVETSAPDLPGDVESVLAWAVREAATNVVRHSGARACAITLSGDDRAVELRVDDDGAGAVNGAAGGTGLAGLAERARPLHGTLEAGARPGGGFRLRLTLPREAA
jgi:two-component system, NarL family, sensor histidine kinase DesK